MMSSQVVSMQSPSAADAEVLAQLEGCDFVDFGCKTGGSFSLAEQCLGGTRGLGVDHNPAHVEAFRAAGGRAIHGDVTRLSLPDKCVRFVCISHVLEHLPSMEHVRAALVESTRVATDFVAIVGPFFDADDYLKSVGVKFYWSDWKWHPTHVSGSALAQILWEEGLSTFTCWGRYPIRDTDDVCLLPLAAPRNQQKYDAALHPPKGPRIALTQPAYKEVIALVPLRPLPELETILRKLKVDRPLGPYSQLDIAFAKYWKP